MKYPDKERIAKVLRDIEKKVLVPTRVLSTKASVAEKMKFALCQKIIRYKRESGYSSKDIAKIIGVTPAVVSRIVHCHIEKFKIDSLLFYYENLLLAKQDTKALRDFRKQFDNFLEEEAA